MEAKVTPVSMVTHNIDGTMTEWLPVTPLDQINHSPMGKEEFNTVGKKIFSKKGLEYGWKTYMSRFTGASLSGINAWAAGRNKVPSIIAWLLRVLYSRS